MKNFPLVSIVTPAYNQAEYLVETIESVLAQDYPNIEYIVLDDGSTDGTPEVLKGYSERVKSVRNENKGQACTLNEGWARTSGKYIGYISSDDILYPDAVRKMIEILDSDNSIVCAFPDCDLIDDRTRVIKKNVCRPFNLSELVVLQECYIGPGALFRRSAFEVVGGWKPELKLAPDREFWMRLAKHGNFEMCQETLAGYRMHPLSISYKDVSEIVSREYLKVLDEYFETAHVPPDIAARRSEAYGYAHLLLARNCFRAGQLSRGFEVYLEACRLHPPLKSIKSKIKILRSVISKPVRIALSVAKSLLHR